MRRFLVCAVGLLLVVVAIILVSAQEQPAGPETATKSPAAPAANGPETTTLTLCRVYRSITLGDGACGYYCLDCSNCTTSYPHVFSCDSPCGGCSPGNCATMANCDPVRFVSGHKALLVKTLGTGIKLKKKPHVLIDTDVSKQHGKRLIWLDVQGDGKPAYKMFLVTAKIDPPADDGIDPPEKWMGFARQIETGEDPKPSELPADNVTDVGGGIFYRFTWDAIPCIGILDPDD